MNDAFTHVNWIALAVATVVAIALGGVYFALLVPKRYLAVLGRKEMPAQGVVDSVGPVVCMFVTVLTSAVLVAALDLTSVGDAVVFGLVTGVGYLVAMTFQIALNPNFPHPIRYGLLNAPFFIVLSLVTSLLLVLV